MDKIINIKNLNKTYGEEIKTHVLHNVDLSFERSVFTAIIGPSGSGKTTLLNIISLLDPPTSGVLDIDGNDFSDGLINTYAGYRNSNIGFIFQFHYLLPEFTCLENILIPHWIGKGKPAQGKVDEALALMNKIGITAIKNKYPNQISGGQQQRTAIARALIKNPKIIFADEPTGNLDRESGDAVLNVMIKMVKENGTTLIMVTHDREIALKADRIIELVDGKVCRIMNLSRMSKSKSKKMLDDRSCTFE